MTAREHQVDAMILLQLYHKAQALQPGHQLLIP